MIKVSFDCISSGSLHIHFQDDPIFHNNSNNPQMEVKRQFAIFLTRLGRYGTGAVVDEVAEWASVSVGTVYNCTRRCQVAIMAHHDAAIKLNDEEQIQGAKALAERKAHTSDWMHGFMAVDGTPVKLFAKPGWYGNLFYGKDKVYAIQLTVITFPC
ncbi:uncharacterized protein B0H18DRAFT_886657 [Fomitopsis serialis]|uniref:uncharacterized protein n=1 Tax=Fomitopsis serialis TaxID=139415 RepID=UPI002007D947|nr:uncharacterized protein B0H18DRAFT_886657 [Neoantrodia serialis]KAH9914751.1 hypothetical protein B0H18DRAFT_886657 [Neoantrodia serialis]